MKKLNIAEILKDCPKGMELDCTMYDKVTLIEVDNSKQVFPITVSREDGYTIVLTKYGQYTNASFAKCIIFPKGETTWEGFQRPFKDGDILATDLGSVFYLNTRLNTDDRYGCYVGKGGDGSFHICEPFAYKECCGLATEEEKQKLFDAIKVNGYKWNAETKTLEKLIEPKFKVGDKVKNKDGYVIDIIGIDTNKEEFKYKTPIGAIGEISFNNQNNYELVPNKFDITTLKPFDKVLVRDNDKMYWSADIYSHHLGKDKIYQFRCIGMIAKQCIPYKNNEYLLGITDDCDEYYKTW